jgi:hypothetical protein
LNFSWEEPAGIATGMATHVEPLHGWRRKSCDYDELRITNFADFDERIYWFKRVDRLADVVREVEATYKD